MNAYGVFILAALLVDYVVHSLADALNLKALDGAVPGAVESLYAGGELDRTKRYVRATTFAGWVERTVGVLALLAFWLAGGFEWLDSLVRQSLSGELARGLAYIGTLALAGSVADVPFDAWRTFVIEARFGFNRTTRRTFVADRLKGLVLGALIGGVLLAAVLLLFLRAGMWAWVLCWLAVVAFSVVTQWLGPSLILPLFNRFDPMPEGALRDDILAYARSVAFPVENLYVIDGSRRSSKANAYFTGLGRKKRIALFDTLVSRYPVGEIVAVLAHEVGHYKQRHVLKGMLLGAAHVGLALFLLDYSLGRVGLYDALYLSEPSLHAGLIGFALLFTPVESLLSVLSGAVSRRHEFQADSYSVSTAPEPWGLAGALKTLSVTSLSHPNPHRLHVLLNWSHPPLARRLEAIERRLAGSVAGAGRAPDGRSGAGV